MNPCRPRARLALLGAALFLTTGCAHRRMVDNPDYQRWADAPIGATRTMVCSESFDGEAQRFQLVAELVRRDPEAIEIVRRRSALGDESDAEPVVDHMVEPARIWNTDHPLTRPDARKTELPERIVTIDGRAYACEALRVEVRGGIPEYGQDLRGTLVRCDKIPGKVVMLEYMSRTMDQLYECTMRTVEFQLPGQPAVQVKMRGSGHAPE